MEAVDSQTEVVKPPRREQRREKTRKRLLTLTLSSDEEKRESRSWLCECMGDLVRRLVGFERGAKAGVWCCNGGSGLPCVGRFGKWSTCVPHRRDGDSKSGVLPGDEERCRISGNGYGDVRRWAAAAVTRPGRNGSVPFWIGEAGDWNNGVVEGWRVGKN